MKKFEFFSESLRVVFCVCSVLVVLNIVVFCTLKVYIYVYMSIK